METFIGRRQVASKMINKRKTGLSQTLSPLGKGQRPITEITSFSLEVEWIRRSYFYDSIQHNCNTYICIYNCNTYINYNYVIKSHKCDPV